jgi:hypothetical protein
VKALQPPVDDVRMGSSQLERRQRAQGERRRYCDWGLAARLALFASASFSRCSSA